MSARCPEGHLSNTEDWCDECGAKIAGDPPSAELPAPPATAPVPRPGVPGLPPVPGGGPDLACPVCGEPRIPGERYCEACSYDFVTGKGPEPASPVPLGSGPGTAAGTGIGAAGVGGGGGAAQAPPAYVPSPGEAGRDTEVRWAAEIAVDRAFFDRGGDDPALFPMGVPPRFVELTGTRTLIGRRSRSRGTFPELDLSVAPEDRGVSRAHAILDHPDGGSLTVTDLGSANGTWVGDDQRPITRGVAVPLGDGARIYVGSWTRITFRAR
jgi:hypothetical protein